MPTPIRQLTVTSDAGRAGPGREGGRRSSAGGEAAGRGLDPGQGRLVGGTAEVAVRHLGEDRLGRIGPVEQVIEERSLSTSTAR